MTINDIIDNVKCPEQVIVIKRLKVFMRIIKELKNKDDDYKATDFIMKFIKTFIQTNLDHIELYMRILSTMVDFESVNIDGIEEDVKNGKKSEKFYLDMCDMLKIAYESQEQVKKNYIRSH
jgi:hypothetical protein